MSSRYTEIELVHESARARVLRARRDDDGRLVLLKLPLLPAAGDFGQAILARLEHELAIGRDLDPATAIRPIALDAVGGAPALVMEDFGGRPLAALLGAPMAAVPFLRLAARAAGALASIHAQGVVHRDIQPATIYVDDATFEVKIAHFDLAMRSSRRLQAAPSAAGALGTLPYMSPEQTGRTSLPVDARSDPYSLGVTLYEALVGALPFRASDPLGWVHLHVAQTPAPPHEVAKGVPAQVSRIVMRLLEKVPEDRYQSAVGLESDLARCLSAWRQRGQVTRFPLGADDVPERLELPRRLYGRALEIDALLESLRRVAADGAPELVLVSGPSGVGKTSLVRALRGPILRERGLFLEQKFEPHRLGTPYATMIKAFRAAVLELLGASDASMSAARERLKGALGASAGLIVELIPELALVLGPQPPVVALPPSESDQRFRRLARRIVAAFTAGERAVTLFLDDLQWADAESLDLAFGLAADPSMGRLLVIGGYRSGELGAAHPLAAAIAAQRGTCAAARAIALEPLTPRDVEELLSDALRVPAEEAAPLARLVHEKTAGNPFFIEHFLRDLDAEGLIAFDRRARRFRWGTEQIRAKSFTDNVADLMVGKLRRLPERTREALTGFACVGAREGARALAIALGRTEDELHGDLAPAAREGLILRFGDAYAFAHDRIRQAAYSLLPEGERAAAHLAVGRALLAGLSRDEIEERLFDVAAQLEDAATSLGSREERAKIAALDLAAGRKAKASAAHRAAAAHLASGLALLPEDAWDADYALTYGLHLERAECAFLLGSFAEAEALIGVILHRARTRVDAAAAYHLRGYIHETRGEMDLAVETAVECLRLFGVELSPHPPDAAVQQAYARVQAELGDEGAAAIFDRPAMTDPDARAAMETLAGLYALGFFTDINLTLMHALVMMDLTLRYGTTAASAHGYAWFGFAMAMSFDDYPRGLAYAKAARALASRPGFELYEARALQVLEILSFWSATPEAMLAYIDEAFTAALEIGDLPLASYCCNHLITDLLTRGAPLAGVQRAIEARLAFVRRAHFKDIAFILIGQDRFVRSMRGLTARLGSFEDAEFSEAKFDARVRASSMTTMVCWHHVIKLMARFFAGDYRGALAAAAEAEPILWSSVGHIQHRDYCLYHALSLAAAYEDLADKPGALAALREHEARFRRWASGYPPNFADQRALIAAEIARVTGADLEAARLYEEAVNEARAHGFVHHQAVALERAARFHRARGLGLMADVYLGEARAAYRRWGAEGKVRQLDEERPELRLRAGGSATDASLALRSEQIDLHAVVKSSQTISREIRLEDLIRTLVSVVLAESGAQRGLLVLPEESGLVVYAEAQLTPTGAAVCLSQAPLEGAADLPASIIQFAFRAKEHVLLDDARLAPQFAPDPYIARVEPRSVLCLPVLRQAEIAGIFYLENNAVVGAFTQDRLAVLELLAAQAAISLDNARLLERERRARALAEAGTRRADILARTSQLLAESLDLEEVLRRLARLCVRFLADWCTIDLVEDGALRRLAYAHQRPIEEPALSLLRTCAPPLDADAALARVARGGEPVFAPIVTRAMLEADCFGEEELIAAVERLGIRSAMMVPLRARGRTLGVIQMLTASRPFEQGDFDLAEEISRRASIALENARLYQQAQEAVRLREEFLSVASHELNTPVTSMTLAIQALRKSAGRCGEASVVERALSLAERGARRLAALVGELLDVTRIEGGALALAREPVDLVALVRDVAARFAGDLEQAGCALSIRGDAPVTGRWDRSRIEGVVMNLLSNAVKFGPRAPIDIAVDATAEGARLRIRDRGIGIELARQPHIFDRFERAVSARHYGGLGLGLYICRRVVEAHGGTVTVSSRPGEGATFTVVLPTGPPAPPSSREKCM